MQYAVKENRIDLRGTWRFQLDEEKCGIAKQWYRRPLKDNITIPGILTDQGYGNEIGYDTPWMSGLHDNLWYQREEYKMVNESEVKVPFLSQPPKHYEGYAWYQKSFEVTQEDVWFFRMECVRWETTVWLNGEYVGKMCALCGHHRYHLGTLKPGIYTLTVLVDNSWRHGYRPDSHTVSDALGANWNGIAGEVCVYHVPRVYIRYVKIAALVERRVVAYNVVIRNESGEKILVELKVNEHSFWQWFEPGETRINREADYPKDTPLWDEFEPHLEEFKVELKVGEKSQVWTEKFGFRKIETKSDGFYLNGRPIYLRGTHFGGDFPLTGYPSVKVEDWIKIFEVCKGYGLNFMRFHSYCPPEAAFEAADRMGIYLHVECGMWNVFYQNSEILEELKKETVRILAQFGNHPSFLMLSPSNEPGGDWYEPLKDWVLYCKSHDDRRIYTIQSGWPYPVKPKDIVGTDYVYFHRSGYGPHMGGTIRNSEGWNGKDYRASLEGICYPVITHEMGQWCAYPDFDVRKKFTGYLRPYNYDVFYEQAKKNHVLSQNKQFVYASGRLQLEMYKEDIEANFRTPHIYGFEMLDLHDYLGQGTALVGILDPFWEEKGYVTPEEFRHFCSETVLLLRINRRIFTNGEMVSYPLELSHFGMRAYKDVTILWTLEDTEERIFCEGCLALRSLPIGKNIEAGEIELDLSTVKAPCACTIKVHIAGTDIENSWDIWVYPSDQTSAEAEEICVTGSITDALNKLEAGKKVLFAPDIYVWNMDSPLLSEKPIFWNAQMGPKWERGLGLLVDKNHASLKNFPTNGYQQWQWGTLLKEARGVNLKGMPSELKPIVQPIDEWNRSFRLGLLVEARVGKGKLLMSGIPLKKLDTPVKIQLYNSLLTYMKSEEFQPEIQITKDMFTGCLEDISVMKRLFVKGEVKEMPKVDISQALLGNPNACVLIRPVKYPVTITLKWEKPQEIIGLSYMPVQNLRDHRGDIQQYEIQVRIDGTLKKIAEGSLKSSFQEKRINFSPVVTTELDLIVKSGFDAQWYQEWTQTKEGWMRKIHEWKEDTISMASLLLVTPDGIYQEYDEQVDFEGGKTATREIDEN